MTSLHPVLVRSPLASYSYTNSQGSNIVVCYQDSEGNIKQTVFNDQDGWSPSQNGIVGRADMNNGIAITGWNDGNELRVYYINSDNKIVERCLSAGRPDWYDGEATGKFTAAHYSNLAVDSFQANDIFCIRVYYQDKDNVIREACRNNEDPWFDGHTFLGAIPGTNIATSSIPGRVNFQWLFFQKADTTVIEYLMQNSSEWKIGVFQSKLTYDPGTYIACASRARDDHFVFTIDRGNNLAVTTFRSGSNSWEPSKIIATTIPDAPVAAIVFAGNTSFVRVYTQQKPSQIAEWGTDNSVDYQQFQQSLPTN